MTDPHTITADVTRPARPATRTYFFPVVLRGDYWQVAGCGTTYLSEADAREYAINELRNYGSDAKDYRVVCAELPFPPAPEPKA